MACIRPSGTRSLLRRGMVEKVQVTRQRVRPPSTPFRQALVVVEIVQSTGRRVRAEYRCISVQSAAN